MGRNKFRLTWSSNKQRIAAFAITFGLIGGLVTYLTFAATDNYFIELETSNLSGNVSVVTASGATAVVFGAGDDPQSEGFPTPESTGPRSNNCPSPTVWTGTLTTSQSGQVVECLVIDGGNLVIRHSNVVVRDVVVNGTGRYMLHIDQLNGICPTNVHIEYTEVDGSSVSPDQIPVYAECGGTFDHIYVHGSGRGIRLVSNGTVTNSYSIADRHEGSMHRSALGMNGGVNNRIVHNTFYCAGTQGCSSAVSAYGDFAETHGFHLENNLVATMGHYCVYGGSVSSDQFPLGYDVKIINNHFSTRYYPNCGVSGPIVAFANGVRGNECYGNVWHETGLSADNRC